ncbi:unnamed protein product [Linum trigynum]|uniref:Uncharacterized protein n=1 Tax=Linum trigynum TaxID=586398 RepID=A0AAV2DTE2_9ROSI
MASASSSVPLGRLPDNNRIAPVFGFPLGNHASPVTENQRSVTTEMQVGIELTNMTSPGLEVVSLAKGNDRGTTYGG